jgi:D-sedoheptulose 7-phosphate isomerase
MNDKLLEYFNQSIAESISAKQKLKETAASDLIKMADGICVSINNGGKLFFAGNGGSAADSQHLSTELVVRLSSETERRALPGLALTTDTSAITACANDFSFDKIFSRQLEAIGQSGDSLLVLSTSGNSANLCEVVKIAKKKNICSYGFLGGDGGSLAALADQTIIVNAKNPGRIQESHIMLGHILIGMIELQLFKQS